MMEETPKNLENEEVIGKEQPKLEETPAEAVPSIFDKPDHNYKKVRQKFPVWLTAIMALLICGGIVFVTLIIPKFLTDDNIDTNSTVSQAEVTITLTDYSKYNSTMDEVAEYGKGGVKDIIYTVGGYDFILTQGEYEEVTTDAEGNEKKEKLVGWTITNHEGINWSKTNVSGIVQNALQVTAITKLEQNASDLSKYGLEDGKNYSSLTVNFKNSSGYTVIVGNSSSDNSGRYIRFEGENTVYLSSFSFSTYTSLTPKDLPALTGLGVYQSTGNDSQYYSGGTLTFFDGIFIFGNKIPQPISFAPADIMSTYTYYKLITPVELPADDTAVQTVFSLLTSGISASEVLEFLPDKEKIKEYGISVEGNDNNLKVMYIVGGVTYQFCVGNMLEDGSYPVMVNTSNVIYKVNPEVFSFIDYKYTDYTRKNLFLVGITEIESFSVTGEGIDETFFITNIAEDAENNVYKQTVKNKAGKSIDDTAFKNALATFQRLQATDFDDENFGKTDKKPSLTITVKYTDKERKDSVITMYEFSSRRYLYKIDSDGNVLISIGNYNDVVNAVKAAVKAVI